MTQTPSGPKPMHPDALAEFRQIAMNGLHGRDAVELVAEIDRLNALLLHSAGMQREQSASILRLIDEVKQRDALLAEIKATADEWFGDPYADDDAYLARIWDRFHPRKATSPAPEPSPANGGEGWVWHPSKSPCRKCGALTVFVHEINDHPDLDIKCTTCGDYYQVDGPDA